MFVLPSGWRANPAKVTVSAEANAEAKTEATISVPAGYANSLSRVAIALDVMADGKSLGQIAEAVVDLKTRPD
jgi:hypothetical protein